MFICFRTKKRTSFKESTSIYVQVPKSALKQSLGKNSSRKKFKMAFCGGGRAQWGRKKPVMECETAFLALISILRIRLLQRFTDWQEHIRNIQV